jgi:hypothetical protein
MEKGAFEFHVLLFLNYFVCYDTQGDGVGEKMELVRRWRW